MFKPEYSCNNCGTVKKLSDNWIAIRITKERGQSHKHLEVRAFDDSMASDAHYCGQACSIKDISLFLASLFGDQQQVREAEAKLDAIALAGQAEQQRQLEGDDVEFGSPLPANGHRELKVNGA